MVGRMKTNVGVDVGVSVGVEEGCGVGVLEGGAKSAVCVAAAPAVPAMAVRGWLGSKVGMGVEPGNAGSVGTHASINRVAITRREILFLRRIIAPTPISH